MHRSWGRASLRSGTTSLVMLADTGTVPTVPGAAAALSVVGWSSRFSQAQVPPPHQKHWRCCRMGMPGHAARDGTPCPSHHGDTPCLVHEEPCGELTCACRGRAPLWLFVLTALASPLSSPPLTSRWVLPSPRRCRQLVFFMPFSHFLFPAQCATPSPPTSPASPTPPTNPLSSETSRAADNSHFMRV